MEFIKTLIFSVASIVLGLVIYFAPDISGTVVIFYVSILTGYIGLDVVNMIKSTSLLPPGEFKPVKTYRYVFCFVVFFIEIIVGVITQHIKQVNMNGLYTVLVSAIFLLAALLIGGLEGNKFAIKNKECKEKKSQCEV